MRVMQAFGDDTEGANVMSLLYMIITGTTQDDDSVSPKLLHHNEVSNCKYPFYHCKQFFQ